MMLHQQREHLREKKAHKRACTVQVRGRDGQIKADRSFMLDQMFDGEVRLDGILCDDWIAVERQASDRRTEDRRALVGSLVENRLGRSSDNIMRQFSAVPRVDHGAKSRLLP